MSLHYRISYFLLLLVVSFGSAAAAPKNEVEPNDTTGNATTLSAAQFGKGAIGTNADIDIWRRASGELGDTVFAAVDTAASASSKDSFLELLMNDGSLLESDNDSGVGGGSVIAGAVLTQNGNQFFKVSESGANNTISAYEIHVASIKPANAIQEVEPNDQTASAQKMSAQMISGSVSPTDTDIFKLTANTLAQPFAVIIDNDPDNDSIFTDTVLEIVSAVDDSTVIASGLNLPGRKSNVAFFKLPLGFIYYVRIKNAGSAVSQNYRFVAISSGEVVATQACCLPDEELVDSSASGCAAAGGVALGVGTTIENSQCLPTATLGACCIGDCSCQDLSKAACLAQAGRWSGNGSSCAKNGCAIEIVDDQALFSSYTTPIISEDFNDLSTPIGGASGCGHPLPNGSFCTGLNIPAGLLFSNSESASMSVSGSNSFGGNTYQTNSSNNLRVAAGQARGIVTFSSGALGVELGLVNPVLAQTRIVVKAFSDPNLILGEFIRTTHTGERYFGIRADQLIGSIELESVAPVSSTKALDFITLVKVLDADADQIPDLSLCGGACAQGNVEGCADNCPLVSNTQQEDPDGDGVGSACDNCAVQADPSLLDSDADTFGDVCESCPFDSAKLVPGVCGCGQKDDDLNSNGTVDCLKGAELRLLVQVLNSQVKKIKLPKNAKGKKAAKVAKTKVSQSLKAAKDFAQANASAILLTGNLDLIELLKSSEKKIKKALKLKPSFKKDKSQR